MTYSSLHSALIALSLEYLACSEEIIVSDNNRDWEIGDLCNSLDKEESGVEYVIQNGNIYELDSCGFIKSPAVIRLKPWLMEPNTKIVYSEPDWRMIFEGTDPELWGGDKFEDAGLIPVLWVDGVWMLAD